MKSYDGFNEFIQYEVTLPKGKKKISIKPFGDIHRDAKLCDVRAWARYLKKCEETQHEGTVYVGMGDYWDFLSGGEKRAVRAARLHDTSMDTFDEIAMTRVSLFRQELDFMRGHIAGMVQGNHDWEFDAENGERINTGTSILADMLDTTWLGTQSVVEIVVHQQTAKKGGRKKCLGTVRLCMDHGKGSGRLIGSTFNVVKLMEGVIDSESDIYLMGHDHKRGALPFIRPKVVFPQGGMPYSTGLECWVGRTGTFLKTRQRGTSSYSSAAGYAPSSLGTIEFEVEFGRDTKRSRGKTVYDRVTREITAIT